MNKQRQEWNHRQQSWDKTKKAKPERPSHGGELLVQTWVSNLGKEGFPLNETLIPQCPLLHQASLWKMAEKEP